MIKAISDRFKYSIMSSSGEKIYPEDIEKAYAKVAPVKEMCVFIVSGMKGVKESRVLWAVIQPDLDNFREFAEVNLRFVFKERFDNASQLLPPNERLKGFTITLDDLPHNLFGDLKRYAVKEIYEPRVVAGIEGALPVSGELSAEDILLMESEPGIKILKCLKEQSVIKRPIILEDSLELDLGIDSLGRVELATRLELAFDVDIKDRAVSRAFSVKDLILEITNALKGAKDIPLRDQDISLGPGYWKKNLSVLPKKENLNMLELSTGFSAWLFRFILTAINFLVLKSFFGVKAEGAQNVPKKGAYIIYANHSSFLDGPAILACLPRRPVFQLFYFVFGPYFFRPFIKSRVLRDFLKMGGLLHLIIRRIFLRRYAVVIMCWNAAKVYVFFPKAFAAVPVKSGSSEKGLVSWPRRPGQCLCLWQLKGLMRHGQVLQSIRNAALLE